MRPPSAPVTCHPWSAARSCWAIRRTSTDASATCCSAEPDSLPWLRAGNLIRDSFGISACDYRWSAVDDFIADYAVDIIPFDEPLSDLAFEAYGRYGKGRHAARLNMGDCAAYALAKARGWPLLYKGDDFSGTDIERA